MEKLGFGFMRLPVLDEKDRSTVDIDAVKRMVDLLKCTPCQGQFLRLGCKTSRGEGILGKAFTCIQDMATLESDQSGMQGFAK
jgi:hypothetical protein